MKKVILCKKSEQLVSIIWILGLVLCFGFLVKVGLGETITVDGVIHMENGQQYVRTDRFSECYGEFAIPDKCENQFIEGESVICEFKRVPMLYGQEVITMYRLADVK